MNPLISWALFIAVTGVAGAYYYHTEKKKKAARIAREEQKRGFKIRGDNKGKGKKERDSGSDNVASDAADTATYPALASGTEPLKKRKATKQQPSKLAQSSAVDANERDGVAEEQEDEGIDNADFARQLNKTQLGTDLKKPAGPGEKQKTKKQGKGNKATSGEANGRVSVPNGTPYPQEQSTASSTTGADADDDLSPAYSPELGATSATTPSVADVSDMLEAPAKGPAVLNITAPTKPQPVRQPKQQKQVQEPETKKQRQNRRKNDEKKAAREADEKERRFLLEKQLRIAREAEGRPAKNGLGISNAPSSNAWNSAKAANIDDGQKAPPTTNQIDAPLLDTFDEDHSVPEASVIGVKGSSSQPPPVTSTPDIPSEEEQLRMIKKIDSDNAWSTVTTSKAKKSKSAPSPTILSNNMSTSPNKASSSNMSSNKAKDNAPVSQFAGLSVEEPNMDEGDQIASITQPAIDNINNKLASSNNDKNATGIDIAVHGSEVVKSASKVFNKTRATDNDKKISISGLPFPDFMYPEAAARINDKTPAGQLPPGWYHFDTGCRNGNEKIPHRDRAFESALLPLANLPLTTIDKDTRKKARAEHHRYEKALTIYRAHLARTLDHSKWNYDNIKEHPFYEPDHPYALTGEPADEDEEEWGPGFHHWDPDCCICEDYAH